MTMRTRNSFDVVALAKRLHRRIEEHDDLHGHRSLAITPAMSRILENDPDYIPRRARDAGKKQQPVRNPSIRILVEIANALGTTVGDLLGEPWPVSPAERELFGRMLQVIDKLVRRAGKPGVL